MSLSEEGGRYRAPVSKYAEMLAAVTGLFFFSAPRLAACYKIAMGYMLVMML